MTTYQGGAGDRRKQDDQSEGTERLMPTQQGREEGAGQELVGHPQMGPFL